MHSKKGGNPCNTGCVSAAKKQFEAMEVSLGRIAGVWCAVVFVATLTSAMSAQVTPFAAPVPAVNPPTAAAAPAIPVGTTSQTVTTGSVPQLSANSATVSQPAIASTTRPLDDQHRLRPGDKLSFRVSEDGEDAKPLAVTDSGEIELPYGFGRFYAAGKTCRQLAQEVKVALEKDYYKRATVHLGLDAINNLRGRAYVSGRVAKMGPITIPVDTPLKLSQAILLAEPTQWAKLNAVKVVRQKGKDAETMIIDVDAILKGRGRLENDVIIEPDDLIIVPERGVLIGP